MVTISNDVVIDYVDGKYKKVDRLVIKKVGMLPLGDRYEGKLRYWFGVLWIPSCSNKKSLRIFSSCILVL